MFVAAGKPAVDGVGGSQCARRVRNARQQGEIRAQKAVMVACRAIRTVSRVRSVTGLTAACMSMRLASCGSITGIPSRRTPIPADACAVYTAQGIGCRLSNRWWTDDRMGSIESCEHCLATGCGAPCSLHAPATASSMDPRWSDCASWRGGIWARSRFGRRCYPRAVPSPPVTASQLESPPYYSNASAPSEGLAQEGRNRLAVQQRLKNLFCYV